MTAYISRLTLCIGMLVSGALLLIHAQPYDDRGLHELFPGDCAASCFMGIHVGTTTDDQALDLLNSNSWVDAASVNFVHLPPSSSRFDDLAHIQWDWNADRPRLLTVNPQLPDANINIRNHIVEGIAFDTAISAGAMVRNRGNPSVLVFAPIHNRDPWSIEWVYPSAKTQLIVQLYVRACPYLADLWLQPLHVQISLHTNPQLTVTADSAPKVDLRNVLNARERLMCSVS